VQGVLLPILSSHVSRMDACCLAHKKTLEFSKAAMPYNPHVSHAATNMGGLNAKHWVCAQEIPQRGRLRDPEVPRECPQEVADAINACMQVRYHLQYHLRYFLEPRTAPVLPLCTGWGHVLLALVR
jgi:hypothetical protein